MENSVKWHSNPGGRKVLVIRRDAEGTFAAALMERASSDWRVSAHYREGQWPADLGVCLAQLGVGKDCPNVVLTTDACLPVVQEIDIPANLPAEQVRQLLRWEMAALLASSDLPGDDDVRTTGQEEWSIAHVLAGARRTVVSAMRPAWIEKTRQELAGRGLTLAAVLPTLTVSWTTLSAQDGGAARSTALVHRAAGRMSLSIFEHGRLEFFSTYETLQAEWPRNLLADARSFALERLVLCGSEAAVLATSPPAGLPLPEALHDREETWFWQGALHACQGHTKHAGLQRPPVLGLLAMPVPAWRKPGMWWLVAGAGLVVLVGVVSLGWAGEFRALEDERQAILSDIRHTEEELAKYEKDEALYKELQNELRTLEEAIAQAKEDMEKPGASRCARVEYVADALKAIAGAFTKNVRLERFRTDYEGNVSFTGKATHDVMVQEALGHFYDHMKTHPVNPARLTTKRDESVANRVLFTAEETPGVGRAQGPGIEVTSAETPANETVHTTTVIKATDDTSVSADVNGPPAATTAVVVETPVKMPQ